MRTAASRRPQAEPARTPPKPGRIRHDAALTTGTRGLELVVGVLVNVAAARWFAKDQVAVLSWIITMSVFLAVVGAGGVSPASIVLLNRDDGIGRADKMRRLNVVALILTVAVSLVWLVAIGPLLAGASGWVLYGPAVVTVAALIPTAALMQLAEASARACHAFRVAAMAGGFVRRVLILGALALVAAGVTPLTVSEALLLVPLVEIAIIVGIHRRLVRYEDPPTLPLTRADLVETARFSTRFLPASVVAACVPQAGVWLGALVARPADVADFATAMRLSFLVTVPMFVSSRVMSPRIAAVRDLHDIERQLQAAARWAGLAAVAGFVGFVVAGHWMLGTLLGRSYESAWAPLIILTAGQVVVAVTGLCGACLTNRGHEKTVAHLSIAGVVVFVVALFPLGAEFGAAGIALAATLSTGALNIAMWWLTWKRLHLNTFAIPWPTRGSVGVG